MAYCILENTHEAYHDDINPLLAKVLAFYQFDQEKLDQIFSEYIPSTIKNNEYIEKVKARLLKAKEMNERVLVFGDYDADGICSTTMMVSLLKKLNIDCGFYIPNRLSEGYGLNVNTTIDAYHKGYSLIITVDNGVKADEAISKANELKIDVIVCDHHILERNDLDYLIHPDVLPKEYQNLCGAGVVLQLALAFDIDEPFYWILAMAATIGDMVEMFDVNRYIVKKGLVLINQHGFLPITALIKNDQMINEEVIAYHLIPALNTLGRLADQANVNVLVDYLMLKDQTTIYNTANQISALNDHRKDMIIKVGQDEHQFFSLPNYNVYISNEYHEGLIGLLANRFMIENQKPTLVATKNEDLFKFSGRSINGFDIHEELKQYQILFISFGGHKQACGFSIHSDQLDSFIRSLSLETTKIDVTIMQKVIKLDLSDLTIDNIESLALLRPFGTGIKQPLFLLEAIKIDDHILLKGKYPKAKTVINDQTLEIICFNKTIISDDLLVTKPLIGQLSINRFKNQIKMNFKVEDVLF